MLGQVQLGVHRMERARAASWAAASVGAYAQLLCAHAGSDRGAQQQVQLALIRHVVLREARTVGTIT